MERHHPGIRRLLVSLCFLGMQLLLLASCASANLADRGGPSTVAPASPTVTRAVVPAATSGWAIYTDHRFPIRFPVPPGWVAGSHTDDNYNTANCEYVVDLFPQGSIIAFIPGAEEKHGEEMFLKINLACAAHTYIPANDPFAVAESAPILFSGNPTTLYDNKATVPGSQREASQTFGGHQYLFVMDAPTPKGPQDIALFLGVLSGFRYMGA